MSYENEKLMNLEDGRELLKVLDGKKANADSMFLYKSAFPGSVVEVEDAVAECVKQMQIEIAPVQDLHGYGKPWVGGAGKNIAPITVAGIKSANSGTWSGNSITISGVTYTIKTDSANNVVGIAVSGTATADSVFYLFNSVTGMMTTGVSYILNGCISGGSSTKYKLDIVVRKSDNTGDYLVTAEYGSGVQFTASSDEENSLNNRIRIVVYNGNSVSGTFYPMFRLASVADGSFAPYTNICPISGHTGCEIVRTGKNLFDKAKKTNDYYISSDGEIVANASWALSDYIPVAGRTIISYKGLSTVGTAPYSAFYDANKRFIESFKQGTGENTVSVPSNAFYVRFSINRANDGIDLNTFIVVYGCIVGEYEAYTGKTFSISFPSPTPGTVYGGTLTLNQDGTGTLVVDRAGIDLGYIDWGLSGGNDSFLSSSAPSGIKIPSGQTYVTSTICSQYPASAVTGQPNFTLSVVPSGKLKIYDSRFNLDATAFKTAMNGVVAVYPLAASTTYTLSVDQVHLLLGYNTLYASTGSILSMLYPTSQVEAVANAKADGILESLSTPSAVMSFSDGADGIPMGVEVAIEPVQDLHGYDKPWPAGAGKNLFDPNSISKQWVTPSGAIQENDETKTVTFGVTAGQTYTLSNKNDSSSDNVLMIAYLNSNNERVARNAVATGAKYITLQAPNDAAYIIAGFFKYSYADEPQLELGSSATSYEPYSNICPISGFDHAEVTRTGKNLFNGHRNDGFISDTGVEGTDGTNAHSDFIPVVAGESYVYSWKSTSSSNVNRRIHGYDKNKNWVQMIEKNQTVGNGSKTFTVPNGVAYIRVQFLLSTTTGAETEVQIEKGTSATTYEPYSGNTYSITFPTSAGTVYGGTLKVNKDGTGSLVVDRAFYTVPQITQDMLITSTTSGSTGLFIRVPTTGTINGETDVNKYYAICSAAKAKTNATRGGAWTVNAGGEGYTNIWIPSGYTLADLNEKFQGQQIVSTLKTKSTYTLPAPIIRSLLGQNNLWSSTGNVNSASYSCDTRLFIEKLFNSITSAEGQTF